MSLITCLWKKIDRSYLSGYIDPYPQLIRQDLYDKLDPILKEFEESIKELPMLQINCDKILKRFDKIT